MSNEQNKERARQELCKIVDLFQREDLTTVIKKVMIEQNGKPSDKWSLGNKLLMIAHETFDARTFNQWKEVGRFPKKGSKGFWIIAPCIKIITITDKKTGKEEQVPTNLGFTVSKYAEFRYEDTEGKELELVNKPLTLPPLVEVAEKFGSKVRYDATQHGEFASVHVVTNEIRLCTTSEVEFFHELAHLAHKQIENIKAGQHQEQEAIAELTACVLASLYGIDVKNEAWTYIKSYTETRTKESVGKLCFSVLSKVQKVLDLILENAKVIEVVA